MPPQDGHIDVAAADHGEAGGAVEEAAAGQDGDGLFAGVDDLGIFFALVGEGAHAQQTVFGVQPDRDALGQVVGHQGGDADAEVDGVTVFELGRRAGGHFFAGARHGSPWRECDFSVGSGL
jgi:hypothetical protein